MRTIEQVLDLDAMRVEIADLGEQVAAPDLWDDQANATRVTGRLSALQGEVDRFAGLAGRIDDLEIMVELGQEEGDADALADAERELARIKKSVEALEVRTLLSGEYDAREALVTIRSGAGGVDAADFAEMLMRMYMRWAEQHKYPVEVFETSYAEEAGLKSATFAIHAPYAYGTLSVEAGTHRLVRISPFDNQGRRQTSFAAVEVVPVLEQTDEIDIPDEEIRVDVYRSGGPGGQSVNTTDSAVRLTHIPTGTVVSCQNEKSQLQNKASAMVVLKAKLLALKKAEEKAHLDGLRGDVQASWGDQMRNYVLNPYQIVKDLRTGYEVGNPQAVFDGDLDGFLEAGIRWRRGADKADEQLSSPPVLARGATGSGRRPGAAARATATHHCRPGRPGRVGAAPRSTSSSQDSQASPNRPLDAVRSAAGVPAAHRRPTGRRSRRAGTAAAAGGRPRPPSGAGPAAGVTGGAKTHARATVPSAAGPGAAELVGDVAHAAASAAPGRRCRTTWTRHLAPSARCASAGGEPGSQKCRARAPPCRAVSSAVSGVLDALGERRSPRADPRRAGPAACRRRQQRRRTTSSSTARRPGGARSSDGRHASNLRPGPTARPALDRVGEARLPSIR